MANHYYTENPELAHDLESWSFHYVVGPFSLRPIAGSSQEEQWIMVLVLIDAFEWENLPAGRLLDVGCGYGPIGLS